MALLLFCKKCDGVLTVTDPADAPTLKNFALNAGWVSSAGGESWFCPRHANADEDLNGRRFDEVPKRHRAARMMT